MRGKLVVLREGSEQPFPGLVTHSSTETSWPGFPIESRRLSQQGSLADFELMTGCLALCVRGRCEVTLDARSERQNFEVSPGKVRTGRPGYAIKELAWTGAHEAIVVLRCAHRLPLLGGWEGDEV